MGLWASRIESGGSCGLLVDRDRTNILYRECQSLGWTDLQPIVYAPPQGFVLKTNPSMIVVTPQTNSKVILPRCIHEGAATLIMSI